MTNKGWLIASAAAATLVACGGGGGDSGGGAPPPAANRAPTANFAFSCNDLTCAFTSTSTDQDAGDAIAAYSWSFGDGSAGSVTTANATHTFTTAGSYDVTLQVGDRASAVSSVVKRVSVTATPVPAAPHASFSEACVSLDCTFTDTSTFDAGSMFQSRTWDFGDGTAASTTSPASHRFAATALTSYNVKLTVVDAAGKSSSSTKSVVVAPPASTLNCTAGTCTLVLAQAAKVNAALVSRSCSAQGNAVVITAPITETVFADGCIAAPGTVVTLNGGATFAANTQLQVEVRSGSLSGSSLAFTPAIRVTGDFANGWTLTFDDGYGGPNEPDFNDLVILIKAAP